VQDVEVRPTHISVVFLAPIADAFRDSSDVEAADGARAVFQVFCNHMTVGEIEGVKHCLPPEIRELWQ
jgi:uncharacterized protein (DUF2267 family)